MDGRRAHCDVYDVTTVITHKYDTCSFCQSSLCLLSCTASLPTHDFVLLPISLSLSLCLTLLCLSIIPRLSVHSGLQRFQLAPGQSALLAAPSAVHRGKGNVKTRGDAPFPDVGSQTILHAFSSPPDPPVPFDLQSVPLSHTSEIKSTIFPNCLWLYCF